MLKKYTKYAATAFAVASLSTFMIGCGGDDRTEAEAEAEADAGAAEAEAEAAAAAGAEPETGEDGE